MVLKKPSLKWNLKRIAQLRQGRSVLDSGSNESGEARKARQNDQHASLHTVVKAAAEAIEQACKYCALWLGLDDSEIRFTVPLEFAQDIDPQILAQLSNLMLAGKVSSGHGLVVSSNR